MQEHELTPLGLDASLSTANRDAMLTRYHRIRKVGRNLADRFTNMLSKEDLHAGGKRLGIFRGGNLVFESDSDTAVFIDYCIYDVKHKGKNVIERFMSESPPAPDSEEMACLQAMRKAFYSLFAVETVIPDFGVIVTDMLSKNVLLIIDLGLSSSAHRGLIFLSRLILQDDFAMTTGAALPVSNIPADQLDDFKKNFANVPAYRNEDTIDPAQMIRSSLKAGSSSHVSYQEPSRRPVHHQSLPTDTRHGSIGRNAPCPCGSGRKFKHCCINRP